MAVFPNGSDETWVEVVDRRGSAVRATVTPMVVYRTCRCEQFALFATNVRDLSIVRTMLFLFGHRMATANRLLRLDFLPCFFPLST
jgi:hypothetical protein